MKLKWFCEVCWEAGELTADDHSDVMSMVYAIEDAHKAKSSGCMSGCMSSFYRIRVRVGDGNTAAESEPPVLPRKPVGGVSDGGEG